MARSAPYPASVDPAFPKLPPLPDGWTRTTFGEVVETIERPIRLDPKRIYKLVNAKRSRGGIVLRDELRGAEVLTKTQFEVHAGDFLISRRQIIHGACGIVPDSLHGAAVSNEYSALRPRHQLHLEFLKHLSHSPYFQRTCFHSSHGVDIEKMVFQLDRWLGWPINLPPLREQRKIAGILGAVCDAIESTQTIIAQVQTVKQVMLADLIRQGMPGRHKRLCETEVGSIPMSWSVLDLGTLLEDIQSGWSPQCEPRPAMPDEWGVLKISAVSWGQFNEQENKKLPAEISPKPELEVKRGDVLLSRANTTDLVGRSVLVGEIRSKLMLCDKILRLRPRRQLITPEFLNLVLSAPSARRQIEEAATGTSDSMRNVSQEKLRATLIPVPPLAEQLEIFGLFDAIAARGIAEEAKLLGLSALKGALMSALLDGKVRVQCDEAST